MVKQWLMMPGYSSELKILLTSLHILESNRRIPFSVLSYLFREKQKNWLILTADVAAEIGEKF